MDCTGTTLEASLANPRGALGESWIIVDVGSIPSTGHGVTQCIPVPPRALSLCLVATCVSFSEEHPCQSYILFAEVVVAESCGCLAMSLWCGVGCADTFSHLGSLACFLCCRSCSRGHSPWVYFPHCLWVWGLMREVCSPVSTRACPSPRPSAGSRSRCDIDIFSPLGGAQGWVMLHAECPLWGLVLTVPLTDDSVLPCCGCGFV